MFITQPADELDHFGVERPYQTTFYLAAEFRTMDQLNP
jgi:hypothetical protein